MPSAGNHSDFACRALRAGSCKHGGFRSTSQHPPAGSLGCMETIAPIHRRPAPASAATPRSAPPPAAAASSSPTSANPDGAAETVAAIEAAGGEALALKLDLDASHSFEAFAATLRSAIEARWHRTTIDGLVNNAGFALSAPLAETTEEQFDALQRVLLKAPTSSRQRLLPLIADGGAIVNVTSSSALPNGVSAGYSAYGTMKGGLAVLTRYMAKELAPRGIRVNAVAPGPTRTRLGGDAFESTPQSRRWSSAPRSGGSARATTSARRSPPSSPTTSPGSPASRSRSRAASTSSDRYAAPTYSARCSPVSVERAATSVGRRALEDDLCRRRGRRRGRGRRSSRRGPSPPGGARSRSPTCRRRRAGRAGASSCSTSARWRPVVGSSST